MSQKFERFSRQARRVLTVAQEEAQTLRHGYIGTEHLLLGLAHEESGAPSEILLSLGVDLSRARAMVGEMVNKPKTGPFGRISLTPSSKRTIEMAVEEAQQLGHAVVGAEHLLLGLLRQTDDVVITILKALGVERKALHEQVMQALRRASEATTTSAASEGSLDAFAQYFHAAYLPGESADAQKALSAISELLSMAIGANALPSETKRDIAQALIAIAEKAEAPQRNRLLLKGTLAAIQTAMANVPDSTLLITHIQQALKLN